MDYLDSWEAMYLRKYTLGNATSGDHYLTIQAIEVIIKQCSN